MATLFLTTDGPTNTNNGSGGLNVGMAFFVSSAANCVGLRFYKNGGDPNSSHTLSLYDVSAGTLVAQKATSGETASGWQEATLTTAVALTPNKAYRVACYFPPPTSYYVYTLNYFSAAKTAGIITGYKNGTVPPSNTPNCTYDANSTPDNPTNDSTAQANYWVDVNVTATGGPSFPLTVADTSSVTLGFHGATGGGAATITKVQGPLNAFGGSGVSTISKAFTVNVTAGNFLVAIASPGGTPTTHTVADSLGQTWTQAVWTNFGSVGGGIFYQANTLPGACTVTLTMDGAGNFPDLTIFEFSGVATSSLVDGTPVAGTGASATPTSGNLTTSNANDLLISGCTTFGSGVTAGTSGWTFTQSGNGNGSEYRIVSATGTYAATYTSDNSNYVAPIAAFKAGVAVTQHFPLAIADTSSVALGFHQTALLHFPIQVATASAVALGFHVTRDFPLAIADTSNVRIGFSFPVAGHNYYTKFPLTEAPINEASHWVNGATTGIDWKDVHTTPGFAFGTQTGAETGNAVYGDSTAILTGSWNRTQTITATCKVTILPTTGQAEVELRCLSSLTAHSCTGYELDMSVDSAQSYFAIVRWNGPLNSYNILVTNNSAPRVNNGDIIKFTVDASGLMIGYLNGVEQCRATDTTYTTGNPGIGMFLTEVTGLSGNFGWSDFGATDGTPIHFPLSASDITSVAIGFHQAAPTILHFPMAIADTSSVAIGFHAGVHLPLQVADTSSVSLGFHVPLPLHFPVQAYDMSHVSIGFRQPLRFPMAITAASAVYLSFHQIHFAFPVLVADTSAVTLTFGNDHYQPPEVLTVAPYAGQTQQQEILVPATIAYREQREEGPWSMPPYAQLFPNGEQGGTDVVPPPIQSTDLWAAQQTWPM